MPSERAGCTPAGTLLTVHRRDGHVPGAGPRSSWPCSFPASSERAKPGHLNPAPQATASSDRSVGHGGMVKIPSPMLPPNIAIRPWMSALRLRVHVQRGVAAAAGKQPHELACPCRRARQRIAVPPRHGGASPQPALRPEHRAEPRGDRFAVDADLVAGGPLSGGRLSARHYSAVGVVLVPLTLAVVLAARHVTS